jgi:hypothetical protein
MTYRIALLLTILFVLIWASFVSAQEVLARFSCKEGICQTTEAEAVRLYDYLKQVEKIARECNGVRI